MATGALEIVAAIRLRNQSEGEWVLAFSGIASLIFGAMIVAWPRAGAVALVWILAIYGLVFGALLIGLGLRLRTLRHQPIEAATPGAAAFMTG